MTDVTELGTVTIEFFVYSSYIQWKLSALLRVSNLQEQRKGIRVMKGSHVNFSWISNFKKFSSVLGDEKLVSLSPSLSGL